MRRLCVGFIAAGVLALLPRQAAAAPDTQPLAAPYLEALQIVTQLRGDDARLDDNSTLDAATKNFLDANGHLFDLISSGNADVKAAGDAAGGLDYQRLAPQLNDIRRLTKLAILRARWRWSLKDYDL